MKTVMLFDYIPNWGSFLWWIQDLTTKGTKKITGEDKSVANGVEASAGNAPKTYLAE
jgi:hypothetical protein